MWKQQQLEGREQLVGNLFSAPLCRHDKTASERIHICLIVLFAARHLDGYVPKVNAVGDWKFCTELFWDQFFQVGSMELRSGWRLWWGL